MNVDGLDLLALYSIGNIETNDYTFVPSFILVIRVVLTCLGGERSGHILYAIVSAVGSRSHHGCVVDMQEELRCYIATTPRLLGRRLKSGSLCPGTTVVRAERKSLSVSSEQNSSL